jgi:hypothetical protein
MKNKAQQSSIGMSFGTMFSIFLIAVFVVFAFVAIRGFLNIDETAKIGDFYSDLQDEIDTTMNAQSREDEFEINLPGKITHVCFANLSKTITNRGPEYEAIKYYDIYDANIFLIPPEEAPNLERKKLQYLNLEEIISNQNPYCVSVKEKLIIKKGFYDKAVTIQ